MISIETTRELKTLTDIARFMIDKGVISNQYDVDRFARRHPDMKPIIVRAYLNNPDANFDPIVFLAKLDEQRLGVDIARIIYKMVDCYNESWWDACAMIANRMDSILYDDPSEPVPEE